MKKIGLLILLILFSACSRNDKMNNEQEPTQLVKLLNTYPLTNKITLNKISNNLKMNKSKGAKGILDSLNLNSAVISDYENTEIRSVSIPISENLSYITYTKLNKVWEGGMLIEILQDNDIYHVKYYDLDRQVIGGLTVQNGIITNAYGINFENKGWWSDWADCVSSTMELMAGGSVGGSAIGLACIAFGPECAAGAATNCAITATFN